MKPSGPNGGWQIGRARLTQETIDERHLTDEELMDFAKKLAKEIRGVASEKVWIDFGIAAADLNMRFADALRLAELMEQRMEGVGFFRNCLNFLLEKAGFNVDPVIRKAALEYRQRNLRMFGVEVLPDGTLQHPEDSGEYNILPDGSYVPHFASAEEASGWVSISTEDDSNLKSE